MVERSFKVIINKEYERLLHMPPDPNEQINQRGLLSLTPLERTVYDLRIAGNKTLTEVALEIGCSSRTVSRIQSRALDKL